MDAIATEEPLAHGKLTRMDTAGIVESASGVAHRNPQPFCWNIYVSRRYENIMPFGSNVRLDLRTMHVTMVSTDPAPPTHHSRENLST